MVEQRFEAEEGFPAQTRCFDGHFPGNPIVPGAVILAWLSAQLSEAGHEIARVDRLKFERPLRPDTAFEAIVTNGVRAEFRTRDGVFARARLALRPAHA